MTLMRSTGGKQRRPLPKLLLPQPEMLNPLLNCQNGMYLLLLKQEESTPCWPRKVVSNSCSIQSIGTFEPTWIYSNQIHSRAADSAPGLTDDCVVFVQSYGCHSTIPVMVTQASMDESDHNWRQDIFRRASFSLLELRIIKRGVKYDGTAISNTLHSVISSFHHEQ